MENRLLSREETIFLPGDTKVWVEHSSDPRMDGVHRLEHTYNDTDVLWGEDGKCWNMTVWPQNFGRKYRVWALPQEPTKEDLKANPWPDKVDFDDEL